MVNDFAARRSPDAAHAPRVLVLGANGRLGRLLARAWAPQTGTGSDFPSPSLAPIWQMRRADDAGAEAASVTVFDPLADPRGLAAAIAASDAVLNLAGPTAVEADHGIHAALARAILAARDRAVPVMLLSSAAVYGRGDGLCAEDATCRPESDYGRGKLAMEDVARKAGSGVHVLRLGNVAGADALLGRAAPDRPIVLDRFEDGTCPVRAYVGPVALARVLAGLVSRAVAGEAVPAILNAAAGQVSMADLLAAAGLGWTPRPAPAAAIREVRLSTRRLDALVALPDMARTATGMVREWRSLAPHAVAVAGGSR